MVRSSKLSNPLRQFLFLLRVERRQHKVETFLYGSLIREARHSCSTSRALRSDPFPVLRPFRI